MTLALVAGLGLASPVEASAKPKVAVTVIEHHEGYDFVEYNDDSYAFFFSDGTYVIYIRKEG